MFDNLNWDAPNTPKGFGVVGRVGKVEITSGAVFTIEKRPKEHWEQGEYFFDGYYFSVGFEVYGCSSAKNFDAQAEVITYLKAQMDLAPQYEAIKAKRDAISHRMEPLNKKWSKTGEQIFSLLKS